MKIFFVALAAAALLLSVPAAACSDEDFWKAARAAWGEGATAENTKLLHGDVTCDGIPDFVGSRIDRSDPDGAVFRILVLAPHGEDPEPEEIVIPYGGATEQYGLCGGPDHDPPAEVFLEPWEPAEAEEMLGMKTCHIAIQVVDGMCDSPRFFQATEGKPGEPRFVFFRH